MKFAATVALLAGVAAAGEYAYPPSGNDTYVTKVLTAYTTYCPGPTSITHGGKTYTVTEATTLTITDCPCTVTYPVYTSSYSACNTCAAPPPPPYSPAPTGGYLPPGNGSLPVPTGGSAPPPSSPSSPAGSPPGVSPFPGAASKVGASGAGLAALLGLAVFAL